MLWLSPYPPFAVNIAASTSCDAHRRAAGAVLDLHGKVLTGSVLNEPHGSKAAFSDGPLHFDNASLEGYACTYGQRRRRCHFIEECKKKAMSSAADLVRGMTVKEIRTYLALVRECHRQDPIDFHTWFLPGCGLLVSEFCLGYLLKS